MSIPAGVIARRRQAPHCRRLVRRLVAGRAGLEIGGPSLMFEERLPVYQVIGRLDNVNFSNSTVWEGAIEEGDTFVFDPRREPGRQYVLEATDLGAIGAETYDVVLSSHTLEHSANPLQALGEWKRVLRLGGTLVLVLPHKEGTFDHRRPVTPLEHLVDDFERGTTEDDLTHYEEIMELHDLALDPGAGSAVDFAERSKHNAVNRCFHQHVFDTDLAAATVDRAGMQILTVEPRLPHDIFLVARRVDQPPDNEWIMGPQAHWRRKSPFALDRAGRVHGHAERLASRQPG